MAAVTTSTADSASSSDAVAYRTLQSGMLVGFYDDAQVYGRTDWAFKQLRGLRAGIVRITIDWSTVARRRPQSRRPGGQRLQLDGRRPRDLEGFGEQGPRARDDLRDAALGRPCQEPASEPHDRPAPVRARRRPPVQRHLPRETVENEPERAPGGRHWLAWNEPNNPVFLKPQWKRFRGGWRPQSAFDYAKICSAVWAGVHSTRLAGEKVACGATGPRGNDAPRSSRPSTSPLVFMTWLRRAGLKRFDAYAHHPYYSSRFERPGTVPSSKKSVTLGNIGVLIKQVNRLWGRKKRLWVTEYGYQTSPPDRQFGVRYATQAKYVHQAFAIARRTRRIDMIVWFLIRGRASPAGSPA